MSNIFNLFSCCIPVKGFLRTIIYDLQRKQYIFVPNEFYNLIISSSKIITPVESSDYLLQEIIDYLIENEFGFLCSEEEQILFPQFDLTYETFYDIDSAIIDLDHECVDSLGRFIDKNKNLLVNAIQLRIFFTPNLHQLSNIIKTIKKINTCSIELVIPYSSNTSEIGIELLIETFKNLTSISIYSAPFQENLIHKQCGINYYKEIVINKHCCGKIDENLFSCNLQTFCESQSFNTCLNKKVSIDLNGDIKNCPSCAQSFGNIKNTTFHEVLSNPDFKKAWIVSKEQIDVCKECEFRHMCTDCRAYIKDSENIFSQPSKCTYNPYIAKWQKEEGYVSVENCGVYSKEKGFMPNIEDIKLLNLKLWGS